MAKTMARIAGGIVTNLEWYSDYTPETQDLKNALDIPVSIGDTYREGKFFRQGAEVRPPLEEAYDTIAEFDTAMREIEKALGVST